jgi:putative ABC transport system substrate-binding protein
MIARRAVVLGMTAAGLSLPVRAQPATQMHRIGMLETMEQAQNATNFKALREALGERGYIEGRNLVFEYRSAGGHSDRFPALADELVHLNVDVIVTRGTPAAIAARNATMAIPIVMAASGDPLSSGVIASLARPGGNVTGLNALVAQLTPKRLELIHELAPAAKTLALIVNGSNPGQAGDWGEAVTAAPGLGLRVVRVDIRRPDDVQPQIETAIDEGAQAFVVGIDSVTQTRLAVIAELLARRRIPGVYAAREFVDGGGLISYGVDYAYLYRRAASYIDKLLKGAKPADLPVEQPVQFEMVVNLKAAKALGLSVPPTVLARADEVLE